MFNLKETERRQREVTSFGITMESNYTVYTPAAPLIEKSSQERVWVNVAI